MERVRHFALAFVYLASLAGGVRASDKRAYEISDYYATAQVGDPKVSPDGARVAFTVRRYDLEKGETWSEIWMMAPDGSGLRQVTQGRHDDASPAFSPDGKRLLFVSDRSGTSQLHVIPVDGGEGRKLTSFSLGVWDPVWSPDGRTIAVTSEVYPECGMDEACNKKIADRIEKGKLAVHVADDLLYRHWTKWRDGRYAHVLLVDAETGDVVRDLTPGSYDSPTFSLGGGIGYAFSPDGKELCYVSNRDAGQAESTNADLWIVPVEGTADDASPVCLTSANDGWDGDPVWSPDGRTIAYISQERPGYESDVRRIALVDRASGRTRYLTGGAAFDDMVQDLRWVSADQICFRAERKARSPIFRLTLADGRAQEIHAHAAIGGWELAGGAMVYLHRSIGEPPEIFRATPGGRPEQLTHFNDALAGEVDIRPAEEMWVDGEDGYKIHVFVVKPHGFDAAQRYPLILNVHGGPQGAWNDSYRGDWQVYPGKGYVVAFANPTGSTGYGQDFVDAIACDWGGRVYRDLMKVTDALVALPYVDRDRIGAMGWSYGGYMMMWLQGHTDRFRCLAAMMGIFDLHAFYGATEELWFPEKDLCGTPWESDSYEKWSPDCCVDEFKTPSLVITGERDYRVPYTQSLAYFTALQKMNVPSRMIVYPNAGHWPGWQEMAFYYDAHLDWFHRWLGGEPAPYDVEEQARNEAFGSSD